MFRSIYFIGLALLLAMPVAAKWHRASSDNFVIYADENEKDLREFALKLERYHAAMGAQLNQKREKPSPSNRVTVYVVGSGTEVRKLYGDKNSNVGGFYTPRAGGSMAIIPPLDKSGTGVSESERVLFHEYAHHFMYGSSAVSYPRWLSEGFAEFYSTSKFEKDGSVGLGLPASHRAYELYDAVNVPMRLLLDTPAYAARKNRKYDEFYGKSWGLFHYLKFSKERAGQLTVYLKLVLSGKKEIEASKEAFGDLDTLERDLNKYLRQSRLNYVKILPEALTVGSISITPLDAGETAVMPLVIRSKRGVDDELAKKLAPEVRTVAVKYPLNAAVLAALAEAEFDAGNDAAAIVAADGAIAIDPANINALLQKGYAMARLAEKDEGKADPKRWAKVRTQFVKVNKVENDHPIPLIRYYQSYAEDGQEPPKVAVDGLEWALQLAPFDDRLRMMVAQQQLNDGRKDMAISTLQPLAYSPHESELSAAALKLIEVARAGAPTNAKEDEEAEAVPSKALN